MKKVLILGGASVHCKLVTAAKELGYYTIVTDYLKDSPAKQIADEAWLINIMDVDELEKKCVEEGVDGIVSGWLDPAQRPYQELCKRLSLPCYGTEKQFFAMTDKHAFKEMCVNNDVDIIPEYSLTDVEKEKVSFPVFVKPVDSRGSRGQAICNSYSELYEAIEIAGSESSNGDVIIEKYLANKNSFQVTYFFVDGEAYLIRTADGYKGLVEEKLDKVALCSISPSVYQGVFEKTASDKVIQMLKNIGFENGPAMVQGFYDEGKFRFYDPGLRFPGVEYDLVFKKLTGIDLMKEMVRFSVTGRMDSTGLKDNISLIDNKQVAVLFPTIEAGTISEIAGTEDLLKDSKIVAFSLRHTVGETVGWTYNVNQRVAEIDLYEDNLDKLIKFVKEIQEKLVVKNTEGKDMIYKPLDLNRIMKAVG